VALTFVYLVLKSRRFLIAIPRYIFSVLRAYHAPHATIHVIVMR